MKKSKNQSGQSLIEFLFLFIAVIFLSFLTLKVTNVNLAKRWAYLVGVVVSTDPEKIEIPEIL